MVTFFVLKNCLNIKHDGRKDKGLFTLLKPVLKADSKFVVLSLLGVLSNIPTRILNVYTLSHVVIFASEGSIKKILILSAIYLLYMIISTIIKYRFEVYKQVAEEAIKESIKSSIYYKICAIDVSAYDNPDFYEIKSKVLQLCDTVILQSYNRVIKLLKSIVSAFTYIGILATLSPLVIAIVILTCGIAILINFKTAKYSKRKFDELIYPQRRLEYVNYCFSERQFANDIKNENFSPFLMKTFFQYFAERKEIVKKLGKRESNGKMFAELVLLFSDCFSWVYLGYGIINKKIFSGEFISIINSIWGLTQQLFNVFNAIPQLYADGLFAVVWDEFFEYEPKIRDEGTDLLVSGINSIELRDVTFSYKDDTPILRKISFNAIKGEKVAIVGRNGVGKSTLMKLILRLYEPKEGDIYIDGKSYKTISLKALSKEIAVVFQECNMYSCTIAENILMREVENLNDEKVVYGALEKVGLLKKVMAMPLGINTYIYNRFNDDGIIFSGGELQKLAIARALAKNSSIIILDEPTASLDALSESRLINLLARESNEKILVVISHKLSLIKEFDKIIVVNDGLIVEEGKHSDLIKNKNLYYEMWNTQERTYELF